MRTFEFRVIAGDEAPGVEDKILEGSFIAEAAIRINMLWLERNPEMVCALTCGMIKYDTASKDMVAQVQEIRTGAVLVEQGHGLCIELVALDCAIRRFQGQRAWPVIFSKGNGIFHVVTEAEDSSGRLFTFDPSAELEREGHIVNGRVEGCDC